MDKILIKENFSKASKNYSNNARIQYISANNLINSYILKVGKDNWGKVLDLGCGTGYISDLIISKKDKLKFSSIVNLDLSRSMIDKCNRFAEVDFVEADMDFLPFKNEVFDTIISSFSLQWSKNFEDTLSQIFRILKKDGILIFNIPNNSSLKELKQASVLAGCNFYFAEFLSDNQISKIALCNDFKKFQFFTWNEIYKERFDNPLQALRNIKKIGANYSKYNRLIPKLNFDKFKNFKYNKNDVFFDITWNLTCFIFFKR